jgi:hypothetical protein
MNQLEIAYEELELICIVRKEKFGTLKNVFDLAYSVRRQVEKIYALGGTRERVEEIINHYK